MQVTGRAAVIVYRKRAVNVINLSMIVIVFFNISDVYDILTHVF